MTPFSDDTPSRADAGPAGPAADGLTVHRASMAEWLEVEEWAAGEEWNPGVGDTACFHPTDPEGFFLGRRGGRAVSAVSVVNYSDDFAFLGYYLVDPGHRRTGLGIATWREALPHAGSRTVGLDAVPAQEETYRRSGFTPAYRTSRYSGRPTASGAPSPAVEAVTPAHHEAVAAYDRHCFPADRRGFVERWLTAEGHSAHVFLRDGAVAGYGVIRRARSGSRVGPLFADDAQAAEALFDALIAHAGPNEEVHVDVPEDNAAAVALAASRGLEPGSHTVRMYAGEPPATDSARVFGVTSLELG